MSLFYVNKEYTCTILISKYKSITILNLMVLMILHEGYQAISLSQVAVESYL